MRCCRRSQIAQVAIYQPRALSTSRCRSFELTSLSGRIIGERPVSRTRQSLRGIPISVTRTRDRRPKSAYWNHEKVDSDRPVFWSSHDGVLASRAALPSPEFADPSLACPSWLRLRAEGL